MLAVQVNEHEEAAGAFHQRCNGRAVERPADQVPFPMPRDDPVINLGGALAQERTGEARTPRGRAAAR